LEGTSEVDGGFALVSEGGGQSSSGVCCITLFISPVDAFGIGVAFWFEGEAAGFSHGVVESLDEVL